VEEIKKVTVIVPVYKVEKYLPACLDSVLGQSLRELECICIDDASPDRCGEILDEYAARDERVRVLHLPENHMQGYGRNCGLEMARGKYVYFLDSDDMITPKAMEELYELAERDSLDGIYFDSQVLVESEDLAVYAESYIAMRRGEYPDRVMTGQALIELCMKNREWMVYVQRQFWRRDFLLRNELFFPEATEHEDELFSYTAGFLAKRVRYVRKDYFIRRYRKGSVMTRERHPKDFVGYFRIFCRMIEFAHEHQLTGAAVNDSIYSMFTCVVSFLPEYENREDSVNWLSPEEEKDYRLLRAVLMNHEVLLAKDIDIWLPLDPYQYIWLYGAGTMAKTVYTRLKRFGIGIEGFLVTDAEGNPERLLDQPVRAVDSVGSFPEGTAVIIAMSFRQHAGPAEKLREKKVPFFLFANNRLIGPMGPGAETE